MNSSSVFLFFGLDCELEICRQVPSFLEVIGNKHSIYSGSCFCFVLVFYFKQIKIFTSEACVIDVVSDKINVVSFVVILGVSLIPQLSVRLLYCTTFPSIKSKITSKAGCALSKVISKFLTTLMIPFVTIFCSIVLCIFH
ncbi:unnamed protein product [Moneuplotes crassus]|uniref:Uncharacterized protein n=1 Tax=Euplotes crassus TaxID=5936 RepID=A0AAD1Y0E5_EUPCR|nr:unnamed protein product [Moneuplotes crassus]